MQNEVNEWVQDYIKTPTEGLHDIGEHFVHGQEVVFGPHIALPESG